MLDTFEAMESWKVIASEGVAATVAHDQGTDGKAIRLDFDFQSGAGFCVLRKEITLALPTNYQFSFDVRGNAKPNNLEFKLADAEGDDVWWVNRRGFDFPRTWTTLRQKKRHFEFAWGPSGGAELKRLSAIEFAIASAEGGKGSVWFDNLRFEELPPPPADPPAPRLAYSSRADASHPAEILDSTGRIGWRSESDDPEPWMEIDFLTTREIGGIALTWGQEDFPRAYDVLGRRENHDWTTLATRRDAKGGHVVVTFAPTELQQVRIAVRDAGTHPPVEIAQLHILDPILAESPNAFFEYIARAVPRGWYPRYFLEEHQPWTVIGVPGDRSEALIDAGGAIEYAKGLGRIEPFLYIDGRLITWADVNIDTSLREGYLPIPTVHRSTPGLDLNITAVADGAVDASRVLALYELKNTSEQDVSGKLYLTMRPFQILPPWQRLNMVGGVGHHRNIEWNGRSFTVDGRLRLAVHQPPDEIGASAFVIGGIIEHLASGTMPTEYQIEDTNGWASAALGYEFTLEPNQSTLMTFDIPLFDTASPQTLSGLNVPEAEVQKRLDNAAARWRAELNHVDFTVPETDGAIIDTLRTAIAHILINADGPAIQPGSRTYERSWIRDGAITATALLYTGQTDRAVEFLDWYAGYQFPNGKIPCVVDHRGPDPVDEHDSTGEYIFLVRQGYRFARDRSILQRHWPHVIEAVNYLESLRAQRLTEEYRDGPPEKRACYGLVPESISHEGYSAKPMHSYWDDFWVLRGLKDATHIAYALGRNDIAKRFANLRDAFQQSLYASIDLAMETQDIDFIPGCVELGDFDATSTATSIFPGGELEHLPRPALNRTFERYMDFFRDRRDGRLEWEAYTPYEIRNCNVLLYMGHADQAHELLDYFLDDRQPAGWNQWPEVVRRNPHAPGFIGDLPHTWVAAEFVCAVRHLFVYEREADQSLVLAAGVPKQWLNNPQGVAVRDLPTAYGRLSYRISRRAEEEYVFELDAVGDVPPGGFVLKTDGAFAGLTVIEPETMAETKVGEMIFTGHRGQIRFKMP